MGAKMQNLVVRALAGAVFVSILIGALLFGQYSFAIVFGLITALALYEFYGLLQNAAKISLPRTLNIVGGVLLFAGTYYYSSAPNCLFITSLLPCLIPYGIYLLVLFISELYSKRTNPLQSLAYSILGQIYIAVPFAMANLLAFTVGHWSHYRYIFILAVFILIWVNDTFAYLTGMTLGKHRLFERISPKKSWEGFFGGLVFAIIASLILAHFYTELSTAKWIGFAVVVVIFGTFGDLTESLMKRTLDVKDSGNMIPGHGGLLDRFDSTIMAIPAVVIYLELVSIF